MSFIHLHVYSAYSLLTSTATVNEIARLAKEKGFPAVALTDRNVMYGAVAFYKECMKQSIKPIFGMTADIIRKEGEGAYPLVLLAKNREGYANLIKITSAIQTKSPSGLPSKWLKHYAKGLIALTPGMEGEVEGSLFSGDETGAEEAALFYKTIFGEGNFYLALHHQGLPGQEDLLEKMAAFGQKHGIPLAAGNAVSYLERGDAFARECLLAIREGGKLADRPERLSDEFYFKTSAEMAEIFSMYPDALENTLKIASSCNVDLDLEARHLPKYPLPHGETADSLLESLCRSGLEERYASISQEHMDRLSYELSIIKRMNFSDYFLIVWDFMKYARDHGILTGPGRGSAAGSLVAYVLYITDVDPIGYQLLFERFLNPERVSMPDIDIDFPDHRRDEVIAYVARKYGEMHVAQIITFGTLAAKAAARDVGRAFGLNQKELDRLSRLIPSRLGITLEEAYRESSSLKAFVQESDMHRKLFQTAVKLEGLPRHTSTHAAGVVISEQPLVQLVPVQSGSGDVLLTQFSMEYLEETGLLKMDFLGLRNLSLIESILSSIRKKTGKKIDIKKIPLDDKKTFELLGKGETSGVFQLESEGMKKVLVRLKPSRFEDIVAVNALYRPGPMENIPLFIERKHGVSPIDYPHPDLKEILENTYGVIVYQEQIMQIASKMSGFTLGEADLLRRAVSKKKRDILDRERAHFIKGARKKGYTEAAADKVYSLIVKFANYGFNRSHAVAYSFIAYQLAYLKAHYPLFFMSALMTSSHGNGTRISSYGRELMRYGYKLLPPSINRSAYGFEAEAEGVRFGLASIKGVSSPAIKEILAARREKKFSDLFDFCLRVPLKVVNRKVMESLVHSGAFDEFGHNRATLLASLDVAIEHAELMNPGEDGQIGLFGDAEFSLKPKYAVMEPIPPETLLGLEKDVLGLYLSTHPASIKSSSFEKAGAGPIADLQIGKKARIGIYVGAEKKIRTKKGEAMAFYSLSDSSGEMEAVAFPDVYRKFARELSQGSVRLLEGKTEERNGNIQFVIQEVLDEEQEAKRLAAKQPKLYLKIDEELQGQEKLAELHALLQTHPGSIPVILHYSGAEKTLLLEEKYRVDGSEECLKVLKFFLGNNCVVLKK